MHYGSLHRILAQDGVCLRAQGRVSESAALAFTISGSDADCDVRTYSASNLPVGASGLYGMKKPHLQKMRMSSGGFAIEPEILQTTSI